MMMCLVLMGGDECLEEMIMRDFATMLELVAIPAS